MSALTDKISAIFEKHDQRVDLQLFREYGGRMISEDDLLEINRLLKEEVLAAIADHDRNQPLDAVITHSIREHQIPSVSEMKLAVQGHNRIEYHHRID